MVIARGAVSNRGERAKLRGFVTGSDLAAIGTVLSAIAGDASAHAGGARVELSAKLTVAAGKAVGP